LDCVVDDENNEYVPDAAGAGVTDDEISESKDMEKGFVGEEEEDIEGLDDSLDESKFEYMFSKFKDGEYINILLLASISRFE
jgi:hypothetical protein